MNSYVGDSRVTHVAMCRAGLCSVCKYLQGQARDNLQQSVTPGQATGAGAEQATLHRAPR